MTHTVYTMAILDMVVDYPPHNWIASALPQNEDVSTAKDLYYVIVSTTGEWGKCQLDLNWKITVQIHSSLPTLDKKVDSGQTVVCKFQDIWLASLKCRKNRKFPCCVYIIYAHGLWLYFVLFILLILFFLWYTYIPIYLRAKSDAYHWCNTLQTRDKL